VVEQPVIPDRICPGQKTAADLLELLQRRWANATPFKANGQCLLQYYDADRQELKNENFPVKLWVNPPSRFCLHGDIAFNGRGIELGSNEQSFWLVTKPKQIRGYWWGRYDDNNNSASSDCFAELPLGFGPQDMLEGLGLARPSKEAADVDWVLSNDGACDVLTHYDETGRAIKKLYVNCCDFLFRRIEYFDTSGQRTVLIKPAAYKQITPHLLVPSRITIVHYAPDGTKDSLRINLRSIKPTGFSETLQRKLFNRPSSKKFEHVYKIVY